MKYCDTGLVIFAHADSPISPNPMTVENSPHLTLLWSPPFLWPGHRIQLYNVSFAIDGGINTYLVKSSYTSEMVSLTVEIYQNVCGSNYAFVITPMGTQMLPQSIEVSGTTSKALTNLACMHSVSASSLIMR